jgi:hypothetical protein
MFCYYGRVRSRIVVAATAFAAVLAKLATMGCSSSTCAPDAQACDASADGPSSGDSGNTNTCTCAMPDAALLSPTPCCAGGSCVAQHFDGISKTFYDCYGVGSFVTPLALDACRAHFGPQATCKDTTCGLAQVVEGTGPACVTWAYQGSDTTLIGLVRVSAEAGVCECPEAGDPAWY